MSRAPYNVLVLPYFIGNEILYCIFKREDMNVWQFIAGGGENDESPIIAAQRESMEEAGIPVNNTYQPLESMCYVSVDNFSEKARESWGKRYVIPIYTFSVCTDTQSIHISHEHTEYKWCNYKEAKEKLYFDLDKTALYELNERIKNGREECVKKSL